MAQKTILIPLERYQRLLQSNPTAGAVDNSCEPPSGDSHHFPYHSLNDDVILASLPTCYQKKARALLDFIHSQDLLAWDDKGQLLLNNKPHPGTQIIDLIRDSQCAFKGRQPEGSTTFYEVLGNANVPRCLIRNSSRHHQLGKSSSEKSWISWT